MAASAGTIMAAALESAGYKAQSLILAQLGEWMVHLSLLLFVGSIAAAIVSIVLQGQYPRALYLVMGPTMFFFVAQTTIISGGADWQFGSYRGDDRYVDEALGQSVNAEVSWVFERYNRLVSSLVQALIAVFSNDPVRDQLIFMNRERIMDRVFSANLTNEKLKFLVHAGLQSECNELMGAARTIALGNRDPERRSTTAYVDATQRYNELYFRKNHPLDGVAKEYFIDTLTAIQKTGKMNDFITRYCDDRSPTPMIGGGGARTLKQDFARDPKLVANEPLSCQQIWCASAMAFDREGDHLLTSALDNVKASKTGTPAQRDAVASEIAESIANKMAPPEDFLGSQNPVRPDISVIPMVIAGIMLRKELIKDPRSEMFSQYAEHSGVENRPFNFTLDASDEQLDKIVRQRNQHTQAQALRYEVYHFAMTLPYIQGYILYLLAMSFPFFAMTLVIPGYATIFFTWFGAWAWAKSWDVGFAMVMVTDEILWQLMPHNSTISLKRDPNHNPITILESAFDGDPAYSLSMYYNVIGILLNAVPVISAKIFMRGHDAIASFFAQGLHDLSKAMGIAAGDWASTEQALESDQLRNEVDTMLVKKWATEMKETLAALNKEIAQADKMGGQSKLLRGLGVAGMGGGAALGLLSLLGGPLGFGASVGLASAGMSLGALGFKKGVHEERLSNSIRSSVLATNARLLQFQTNRVRAHEVLTQITGGTNGRVHTFGLYDAPVTTYGDTTNIRAFREAEMNRLFGEMIGGTARAPLDFATRLFWKGP